MARTPFDLFGDHPRSEFWLIPKQWETFDRTRHLGWSRIDFEQSNDDLVPSEPGVYAFVLEHRVGEDLPSAFPLYVGMSDHSVRTRYRSYQRQAFLKKHGRPRLDRMFRVWRDYLAFYFVTATAGLTPGQLERSLLDSLIPPMNRYDYSAEVKRLVDAYP